MTPRLLRSLLERRGAREAVVLATRIGDGHQVLARGDEEVDPALEVEARAVLDVAVPRLVRIGGEEWFLEPHLPPARLVVVGAVHIAQFLAPMAASVGFEVTVVDPRTHFASEARFPGIALVHDWPDQAVAALRLDRMSAVVVLTHDPKLDDPALEASLASEAFYVGALGSRRSHGARLERLRGLGLEDEALARIRGPVGLAIGAVSPGEIALSIMADVVAVRRGADVVAVRRGAALGQRG